jgi:hypothetical protein
VHFAKYIKTAFLNRWNLLFFAGALGFSFLSGRPDVFAPLVLAAEVTYLGLLSTHPTFQAYVDAQEAKVIRQADSVDTEQTLRSIMQSLPPKSMERFEALRSRCLELRQIAREIKDPGHAGGTPLVLEQSQSTGLDRLLWIFLRLLFTQYSLERFLTKTTQAQIQKDIDALHARLDAVGKLRDEQQRQKFSKTLEDNLQTCRDRMANWQKARENYELIQLEIDRLENKIRSLSELAVNRQEPDFVSAQVDQVATSMLQTERTMNELQFATGLSTTDEAVPELLQPQRVQVRQ